MRVAIVFGGRSAEHEVSVVSAKGVYGAIDKSKYELVLVKITKQGEWLAVEHPDADEGLPVVMDLSRAPARFRIGEQWLTIDVIFPVLHGPYGEDGTIQGMCELAGIPYVGCGVAASAIAMDKDLTKRVLRAHGIPVLDWIAVHKHESINLGEIGERFGYPLFVKPARLGSSVGITKVHSEDELRPAIEYAFQYDSKIVIEKGLNRPREIECAILGNEEPQPSILGEIIPAHEFYDYDAKYRSPESKRLVPAPLDEDETRTAQRLAVDSFKAIGCRGMARVDMFYVGGKFYVNELNTIPGFTPISMYPKLWQATGLSYSQLIDRLIELALEV